MTSPTYRSRFESGQTRSRYGRDFEAALGRSMAALPDHATVAELGAGANPVLGSDSRCRDGRIDYLRVDISAAELSKGDAIGTAVVADAASTDFALPRTADFAFSKMVAEHVTDGERFLSNVYRSLSPGGRYLQVSPVLFALPFLVNRVAPTGVGAALLRVFHPRDTYRHGKFPARYSWCRGPSQRHLRKLEGLGFAVVEAYGYFGHDYYRRVPGIRDVEVAKSRWLARHPVPALCSFSMLLLERPSSDPQDTE